MRRLPAVLATLLLAVSIPAARAETSDAADAAVNSILSRVLSEQNVGLLFGLLRQSLAAAAEGRPAPQLPPETVARLDAASKEVQRDAAAAALLVLDGAEREVRQALADDLRTR
jgi:hypothetical protein